MRAIVLAGGYAKRLWPLTKDRPKPLLPIGESCILDYIISKINDVKGIEEIIISTNQKFEGNFLEWIGERGHKNISVFPEPSTHEEEKLGPVKAIDLIIKETPRDDFLIAAGDNLFSLDLAELVTFYRKVKSPVIALYEIGSLELSKKYACVEVNDKRKIVSFEEKPERPKSQLVSTGIYVLPWKSISKMGAYLYEGNPPDPIGRFMGWLSEREDVYGFKFTGYWYDIGSMESYICAQEDFRKRSSPRH
jgi:glucose-1-phosphate thymidylyltransferase